ncbi:endolysin [Arthrobacter phage NapoleonB]|uniref:Endolysin n=1 Tax=Arthrobacter phage Dynamite TaxID=2867479 RepID=A0AAE9BRV5_9CAUD|nr:endolysin [Arthrobacter phage Dynamite]QFP94973.1 endolysin [Arthrobacter phage NapoleonB]UAW09166.1 endolysin [Arthrobacter phage Dynamite]
MAAPAANIELFLPSKAPITQGLGAEQKQGGLHAGTDFAYMANGQVYPDIYAAAEGRVIWAGDSRNLGWPNVLYLNIDFDRTDNVDSSAGNYTIIEHYDTNGNKLCLTGYGHQANIFVKVGDWVRAGQIIGEVGDTGFNFGKHLHFDFVLYPYDVDDYPYYGRVDPTPYFVNQFKIEEDDMYTQTDRERDNLVADRMGYLWKHYGPGQKGYKDDGEYAALLRDTKRIADVAAVNASNAHKVTQDVLFSVTPGISEQRPAGATILSILSIVAAAQNKTVEQILEGIPEAQLSGAEFVLVPKDSLPAQPAQ